LGPLPSATVLPAGLVRLPRRYPDRSSMDTERSNLRPLACEAWTSTSITSANAQTRWSVDTGVRLCPPPSSPARPRPVTTALRKMAAVESLPREIRSRRGGALRPGLRSTWERQSTHPTPSPAVSRRAHSCGSDSRPPPCKGGNVKCEAAGQSIMPAQGSLSCFSQLSLYAAFHV